MAIQTPRSFCLLLMLFQCPEQVIPCVNLLCRETFVPVRVQLHQCIMLPLRFLTSACSLSWLCSKFERPSTWQVLYGRWKITPCTRSLIVNSKGLHCLRQLFELNRLQHGHKIPVNLQLFERIHRRKSQFNTNSTRVIRHNMFHLENLYQCQWSWMH